MALSVKSYIEGLKVINPLYAKSLITFEDATTFANVKPLSLAPDKNSKSPAASNSDRIIDVTLEKKTFKNNNKTYNPDIVHIPFIVEKKQYED